MDRGKVDYSEVPFTREGEPGLADVFIFVGLLTGHQSPIFKYIVLLMKPKMSRHVSCERVAS